VGPGVEESVIGGVRVSVGEAVMITVVVKEGVDVIVGGTGVFVKVLVAIGNTGVFVNV
jgi:hypothetical protein